MASIREQIVQSRAAALAAATAGDHARPADLTVHRFRTRPLTADQLPAAVVYLMPETTERGDGRHGYHARRTMRVRVELRIEVPDGTAPDAAMDPYTSWAVQAAMADPTCGGLAFNTQETGTTWLAEEADRTYAASAVDFEIDYVTAADDPDSRP